MAASSRITSRQPSGGATRRPIRTCSRSGIGPATASWTDPGAAAHTHTGSSHALVYAWRGDNAGPPPTTADAKATLANASAFFERNHRRVLDSRRVRRRDATRGRRQAAGSLPRRWTIRGCGARRATRSRRRRRASSGGSGRRASCGAAEVQPRRRRCATRPALAEIRGAHLGRLGRAGALPDQLRRALVECRVPAAARAKLVRLCGDGRLLGGAAAHWAVRSARGARPAERARGGGARRVARAPPGRDHARLADGRGFAKFDASTTSVRLGAATVRVDGRGARIVARRWKWPRVGRRRRAGPLAVPDARSGGVLRMVEGVSAQFQ